MANPASFIARFLDEGYTARDALDVFRSQGGAMRTQTWYRAWGEMENVVSRRAQWATVDPDLFPSADLYAPWSAGRPGSYATQVKVLLRDRETGLVSSIGYTHITDEPHTPAEAMDAGMGIYQQGSEDESTDYDQQVVGAIPIGFYEMQGRQT